MKDLSESLADRLMMWAMKYDIDLQDAQRTLAIVLKDYDVKPKEKALTIYSEGRNQFFLKKFLLAKTIAGCGERTIYAYKNTIEKVLDDIGKDADVITSDDFQCYFAQHLIKGNSKSYVDTIRRYLKSFYNYLIREELISKNPISKVDKIKYQNEKKHSFSDIEIENMRNACENAREKAVLELLLSTGCRASEAVSIKISDIDETSINILGKGGKYRTVYLNAKSIVAINSYLAERKDSNPYLFPSGLLASNNPDLFGMYRHYAGKWYQNPELVSLNEHMSKESVNTCVKKIGKRAGVDGVHTHRFRRTCATMALRRGMPLELVSKMLGHSELQTTQIYLDLRDEDLKIAHEKFVY